MAREHDVLRREIILHVDADLARGSRTWPKEDLTMKSLLRKREMVLSLAELDDQEAGPAGVLGHLRGLGDLGGLLSDLFCHLVVPVTK